MKYFLLSIVFFTCLTRLHSQTNTYQISFDNAVHHEAEITGTFTGITTDDILFRMSRTSPGRYAIHEFAKNVYRVSATDMDGNSLKISRPDPYSWLVSGHNGSVILTYTLFANRGGGTYSQIDETHAHLNIPATFMYAPALKERDIQVDFSLPKNANWKVATQLPKKTATRYTAPNLYYFMDSPIEVADLDQRSFDITENGKTKTIVLALHHQGTEAETDAYFEQVKSVTMAERAVYGELPDFDYNTYTFLACYMPQASGDGMEHRNSTVVTSTRALGEGGMKGNIGTVSHELFHAWNVERIRPKSLEPFNFEEANMSGELWFSEGFTSYYTNLILCRAGIMTPEEYIASINGTFNYVWNSPARDVFNPIEMSYQAPFVDAATSVDPVNRENTFISYYSYGSVLGLALDLELRKQGLTLDSYMNAVWKQFGKNETSITIANLQNTLNTFAGNGFGDTFFKSFIHQSTMPNYTKLLEHVGVTIRQDKNKSYTGLRFTTTNDGETRIQNNPQKGSPAYTAGLDKGDVITSINGIALTTLNNANAILEQLPIGTVVPVNFERFNTKHNTTITLAANPRYELTLFETTGKSVSKKQLAERKAWLHREQ